MVNGAESVEDLDPEAVCDDCEVNVSVVAAVPWR